MTSPPQSPGTVGFVGLGAMGLPMAANLAKAGFDVLVWNRGRTPLDAAVAAGCRAAGRPADVAAGARTVITMLPDLPQVRNVSAGPDGLLAGLDTAAPAEAMDTLVVMGTVSPVAVRALAQELRSFGVTVVDAPVSGGVTGARNATLSIMAGGTQYAVERALPYLTAMGSTVRRMGDIGAGSLAKACNQLVVAGTLVALAEAVVLGEHGGLDPAALLEVLSGGLASSEVLAQKRRHLADSDFTPSGPARYLHKDLGFVLDSAADAHVELPLSTSVARLYAAIDDRGLGDLDNSVVLRLLREDNSPSRPHHISKD
ncbi:3-hydroxyisobutyrate dehydrogenase-like beta-hydroxyacid dehydrogenase [Streptomyces sp. SAI-144]|uniref:NAD(P)-dependent oxidoreductase n=1 Tax=unclassified Streptomyces TaxID=2593676 RepID=UPI0024741C29|nr:MULTISPECIES: NAD(P)-dependent oxidoreductase [unclassified Streptomyces]MDH6437505.1 3-hydroxyisobutyrate dehydrogenase-like beta-hydroxyacid dehydrogenase [Streptomyces sp. SAI-144]MDH6484926.1 3-hydroxyisobutyrate dehydrogenase-like beta-hydroxyacid dehydrogenase [Streptomyces sp. SAI-127]